MNAGLYMISQMGAPQRRQLEASKSLDKCKIKTERNQFYVFIRNSRSAARSCCCLCVSDFMPSHFDVSPLGKKRKIHFTINEIKLKSICALLSRSSFRARDIILFSLPPHACGDGNNGLLSHTHKKTILFQSFSSFYSL
jgi:hypothetical protein